MVVVVETTALRARPPPLGREVAGRWREDWKRNARERTPPRGLAHEPPRHPCNTKLEYNLVGCVGGLREEEGKGGWAEKGRVKKNRGGGAKGERVQAGG